MAEKDGQPDGPGLCRDCFTVLDGPAGRCPSCHGRRVLSHPELADLAIGHMDCDAFFAAVEKRDDPSLADKPLIIGGGKRGVVSTACYIARLSGVRSAMPMFKALKACPDAVVLKPNMAKYVEVARAIRTRMEALTPLVQPLSLDEAFLDLSGTERLHGAWPAVMLAQLVKGIEDEIGITASVGLSHNKFLAKIASDLDKPRGFAVIGKAETKSFLATLPVTAIWGVGKSFAGALARDGITQVAQIQTLPEERMMRRYGAMGRHLWLLSQGIDHRPVRSDEAPKSISSETTFNEDLSDLEVLRGILWRLCEKVAARSKDKHYAGRVITLKLKTADFKTRTRRRSLDQPTQMAHVLYRHGTELLEREATGIRYRLIGIGLSDLTGGALGDEPDLIDRTGAKRSQAERAMDALKERYGSNAIGLGRGLNGQKR